MPKYSLPQNQVPSALRLQVSYYFMLMPMPGEIIGSKGEHITVVLLNICVVKLPLKYLRSGPQISNTLNLGQFLFATGSS